MACFWSNQTETTIDIPMTEDSNNVTFYKIIVTVGDVKWSVLHRYSEFYQLHNTLVTNHGVSKDILPSKKVIRNKTSLFVENRRQGLEEYCQKILNYFKLTMPRVFIEFFEFHIYDIFYLLQNLSLKAFEESDQYLILDKTFYLTPLEAFALSECLTRPFPPMENTDSRYDFTHSLDLFSQLKSLNITGSNDLYKESNIVPNHLPFDLICFKELTNLMLINVAMENINSLGTARQTLQTLSVHDTTMTSLNQIIQCDLLHKTIMDSSQVWASLKFLNLSNNNINELDRSVTLVPKVEKLILDCNEIPEIGGLSDLTQLSYLSMCNNSLTHCKHLHTKIGNITTLTLSQNSITSLKGFNKLYSLVTLDLSCNKIDNIEELSYIGELPCLENLILTGNPVSTYIDYRTKVLVHFNNRAHDICLDNEKPTQNELDKVSVLRALRIVKEGRTMELFSCH